MPARETSPIDWEKEMLQAAALEFQEEEEDRMQVQEQPAPANELGFPFSDAWGSTSTGLRRSALGSQGGMQDDPFAPHSFSDQELAEMIVGDEDDPMDIDYRPANPGWTPINAVRPASASSGRLSASSHPAGASFGRPTIAPTVCPAPALPSPTDAELTADFDRLYGPQLSALARALPHGARNAAFGFPSRSSAPTPSVAVPSAAPFGFSPSVASSAASPADPSELPSAPSAPSALSDRTRRCLVTCDDTLRLTRRAIEMDRQNPAAARASASGRRPMNRATRRFGLTQAHRSATPVPTSDRPGPYPAAGGEDSTPRPSGQVPSRLAAYEALYDDEPRTRRSHDLDRWPSLAPTILSLIEARYSKKSIIEMLESTEPAGGNTITYGMLDDDGHRRDCTVPVPRAAWSGYDCIECSARWLFSGLMGDFFGIPYNVILQDMINEVNQVWARNR